MGGGNEGGQKGSRVISFACLQGVWYSTNASRVRRAPRETRTRNAMFVLLLSDRPCVLYEESPSPHGHRDTHGAAHATVQTSCARKKTKKKDYSTFFFRAPPPRRFSIRVRRGGVSLSLSLWLWLWQVKRTSLSPGRIRRECPWLTEYGRGTRLALYARLVEGGRNQKPNLAQAKVQYRYESCGTWVVLGVRGVS